jgi:hypothetical protein
MFFMFGSYICTLLALKSYYAVEYQGTTPLAYDINTTSKFTRATPTTYDTS